MRRDGQLDFQTYSADELKQARLSIDRKSFPINFQRLCAELDARQASAKNVEVIDAPVATGWKAAWRAEATDTTTPSRLEFVILVAAFAALVLLGEALGDSWLLSAGLPSGRWLRLVYFSIAGSVVAIVFAQRHRRIFRPSEVADFAGCGYATVLAIELVGSLAAINYADTIVGLSEVHYPSMAISVIGLVLLDVLMLLFALQFPVRYLMRLSCRPKW